MITPEQLAALKEVAETAHGLTPGPWGISESHVPGYSRHISVVHKANLAICDIDGAGSYNPKVLEQVRANAAHIAAFDPTTCLELLEEVERLREQLASINEAIEFGQEHFQS